MSLIAALLISSLVTVIAVIGLADALTHFLCWSARSLKGLEARRAADGASGSAHPERLTA